MGTSTYSCVYTTKYKKMVTYITLKNNVFNIGINT